MGGQAENSCQPALKGGVAILNRNVEISTLLQCLQSVYPNQKAREENGEEKGDNEWTEDDVCYYYSLATRASRQRNSFVE
jgi:hypothetical protein